MKEEFLLYINYNVHNFEYSYFSESLISKYLDSKGPERLNYQPAPISFEFQILCLLETVALC